MTDSPMQHGDAGALRGLQQAAPLPGPTPPGPVDPTQGLQQAAGMRPPKGESLIFRPSDVPGEDVMSGVETQLRSPTDRLAWKVDVLRHLATLPFASEEVTTLLVAAQDELQLARTAAMRPPAMQFDSPMMPSFSSPATPPSFARPTPPEAATSPAEGAPVQPPAPEEPPVAL